MGVATDMVTAAAPVVAQVVAVAQGEARHARPRPELAKIGLMSEQWIRWNSSRDAFVDDQGKSVHTRSEHCERFQ